MKIEKNRVLSDEECQRLFDLMFIYHDRYGLTWPMIGKAVDAGLLARGIKSNFEEQYKLKKP